MSLFLTANKEPSFYKIHGETQREDKDRRVTKFFWKYLGLIGN